MPTTPVTFMLLDVLLGLFLAAISIPLIGRKVKRNYFYGIRMPKTLRDDDIWYTANEYGGRQMLAAGLIESALTFVLYWVPILHNNLAAYALTCAGALIIPLAIAVSRIMAFVGKL